MTSTKGDAPVNADGLTPEQVAILEAFNKEAEGGAAAPAAHQLMPGASFVGCGYNVFGRYASARSCLDQVLDISNDPLVDQQFIDMSLSLEAMTHAFSQIPAELKLIYSLPKTIQFNPLFHLESKYDFQDSIEEQTTKWKTDSKVGGQYGLFTGEAEARFGSDVTKLSTTRYSSLTASMVYFDLRLNYSLSSLPPLKPGVQIDLDNETIAPEAIFAKYGSHYLTAVSVGTRVTFTSTIDTSRFTSKFELETFVKASYGEKTESISAENRTGFNKDLERYKEHRHTDKSGDGISNEQIDAIKLGTEADVSVLKGGWHNPTLIDFPENALQPLWKHCKSPIRAKALEDAFDRLSQEKLAQHHALYTPVYLYRRRPNWTYYRLHRSAEFAEVHGEADYADWTIENDGKPLFHVLSKQLPGSVALREYRFGGENTSWRYETDTWRTWLHYIEKTSRGGPGGRSQWQHLGIDPIGYVFEEPGAETSPKADGAAAGPRRVPIYAYTPTAAPANQHFYYSRDDDDHLHADVGEQWNLYIMPECDSAFLPEPTIGWAAFSRREERTAFGDYFWKDLKIQATLEFKQIVAAAWDKRPQWYAWVFGKH